MQNSSKSQRPCSSLLLWELISLLFFSLEMKMGSRVVLGFVVFFQKECSFTVWKLMAHKGESNTSASLAVLYAQTVHI